MKLCVGNTYITRNGLEITIISNINTNIDYKNNYPFVGDCKTELISNPYWTEDGYFQLIAENHKYDIISSIKQRDFKKQLEKMTKA